MSVLYTNKTKTCYKWKYLLFVFYYINTEDFIFWQQCFNGVNLVMNNG